MQNLYLHIGTAKTGTTSIQQFLLQNRKPLLERFNLLTPKTGRDSREGSHHPLAFSFVEKQQRNAFHNTNSPQQYAKSMQRELKGNHADVLLTSECFWLSRLGLPQFIKEVFPDYHVKVVMYARQIDQYVEAAWSQHVKGRIFTDSFDTFVQGFRYFNYNWPKYWQTELGLDNSSVIIAPYESCQFFENTLLDDFVYRLVGERIPKDFQLPEKFANPRLLRDALEYMLLVNQSAKACKKKDTFRRKLVAFSQAKSASENTAFRSHGLLSQPQRLELLESAKPDDTKIAREYLGREDGKLFYQALTKTVEDQLPYPGLSADTAVEISEYIIGKPLTKLHLGPDLSPSEQVAAIVERTAEAMW